MTAANRNTRRRTGNEMSCRAQMLPVPSHCARQAFREAETGFPFQHGVGLGRIEMLLADFIRCFAFMMTGASEDDFILARMASTTSSTLQRLCRSRS